MYTLLAGVAVKNLNNNAADRLPGVNIFGAPWASLICYILSAGLNILYVARYAGMRIDLRELLLRPVLATLAMTIPVLGSVLVFGTRLQRSWPLMGVTVLMTVVVFGAAVLKTGAVKQSDLPSRFRKGK